MPFSGKNGSVKVGLTAVAEVTKWSFNPTSNNPSWASNAVAGFKQRVAGVQDGSGSFDFKLKDATDWALFAPGVSLTLTLVTGGSSLDFTVPAVIDGVNLECDIDSGEVVGGSADFSCNGAWSGPA